MFCKRTKLGIGLGAAGAFFALVVVAMKIFTRKAPFLLEAVLGFIMLISFAFGTAYITSEAGPGSPLGNLYYFTWISFLSAFLLCSSCFEDYQSAKSMGTEESANAVENGTSEEDQI